MGMTFQMLSSQKEFFSMVPAEIEIRVGKID